MILFHSSFIICHRSNIVRRYFQCVESCHYNNIVAECFLFSKQQLFFLFLGICDIGFLGISNHGYYKHKKT